MKLRTAIWKQKTNGRSREGAWIEICSLHVTCSKQLCRSREGAWIEIADGGNGENGEHCRSREGAWIEIYKQP